MQIRVSQVSKVEPSRKSAEALVGAQEALLGRAVRFADVPQKPVGDPGDLLLVLADEVLEKLGLAAPDLLDQAAFVDRFGRLARNHRKSGHRK